MSFAIVLVGDLIALLKLKSMGKISLRVLLMDDSSISRVLNDSGRDPARLRGGGV